MIHHQDATPLHGTNIKQIQKLTAHANIIRLHGTNPQGEKHIDCILNGSRSRSKRNSQNRKSHHQQSRRNPSKSRHNPSKSRSRSRSNSKRKYSRHPSKSPRNESYSRSQSEDIQLRSVSPSIPANSNASCSPSHTAHNTLVFLVFLPFLVCFVYV
eukprot:824475_1